MDFFKPNFGIWPLKNSCLKEFLIILQKNRWSCQTEQCICHAYLQPLETGGNNRQIGPIVPPYWTTTRDDRNIKNMTAIHYSAKSRTISQQNQSVEKQSVSSHTIQCRLQQSGISLRRPLIHLPLSQIDRYLGRQWFNELRTCRNLWNKIVFTDEYNTMMVK